MKGPRSSGGGGTTGEGGGGGDGGDGGGGGSGLAHFLDWVSPSYSALFFGGVTVTLLFYYLRSRNHKNEHNAKNTQGRERLELNNIQNKNEEDATGQESPFLLHNKEGLTEKEKENLEKRIRVAEQTMKSFEKKGKNPLKFQPSSGKPLPPGQKLTKKWIVLDLGLRPPNFDLESWKLTLVDAKTDRRMELTLDEIKALGVKEFTSDFHCYTGWTIQDLKFTGVPFKRIIEHFNPSPSAKYILQVGAEGYSTNAPRVELEKDDVFLAWEWDHKPIPEEHGIIRLIIPILYGSKSAKFLSEVHFLEEEQKGFWEIRGVHDRGNVMLEERYNTKKRDKVGIEEAERIIAEAKKNVDSDIDLSGLELTELPPSLFELTFIRTLLLFNNKLTTLPPELLKLSKITTLSLNSNLFTEIPPIISKFTKLAELWISDNKIESIPEHLLEAKELYVLGIESNQLKELPAFIDKFESLSVIFADHNQIKAIPREIGNAEWTALLLSGNPIEFVPKEMANIKDITFLGMFGCKCIPGEVLEEGNHAILKYIEEKGDLTVLPK